MLIFTITLLFGWFLTSIVINIITYILANLFKSTSLKTKIISTFLTGLILISILSLVPYELVNQSMNVYCTDGSEETPNPYRVTVQSDYFNSKLSFDLRYLRDVTVLGVIGKTTVSVTKMAPAPVKAVAAIGTASSLGSAYLGMRYMEYLENKNKEITITKNNEEVKLIVTPNPELNGTAKDVEEVVNNIDINSPLESSEIFEGVKVILLCTEILSTIALISFIMFSLFIFIKLNSNKLDKIENAFLIKLINLLKKANNIYIFIWGALTLFDVSMVLYLTIRLSKFLENLIT